MCTGKWAKCTADLLFPLALCCIVANILLFFPNGKVWSTKKITEAIWYLPGIIGGGILVKFCVCTEGQMFISMDIKPTMMLSMVMSGLGVAGTLYCILVSVVGLQDGPLCDTGDGVFIYPFSNQTYLFKQEIWEVCEQPENVVLWNVVLFSILLGVGTLEAVLSLTQVTNGLVGCLCGTKCCPS
uniref:Transmembrane 4 L6 family member 1-like n=1 Tax=Electrophorus electricus TaxID=8005 RepID=A0AAY5E963_ELEEL